MIEFEPEYEEEYEEEDDVTAYVVISRELDGTVTIITEGNDDFLQLIEQGKRIHVNNNSIDYSNNN